MSGGAENFCLKWQHFEANLSSAFQELRTEADFFDVTLVCGDGQHIEAHKVVLSACSVFFRDLLRKIKHPQPLLFLKGVKFSEIVSILNFMYEGEVTVVQDDLNSFLSVAEVRLASELLFILSHCRVVGVEGERLNEAGVTWAGQGRQDEHAREEGQDRDVPSIEKSQICLK